MISVRIDLYNGYGERLHTDGDLLRIWMTDTSNNANVNGYVTAIGNGSYIGQVMAVWKGKSVIKISIANTKEQIGLVLQYVEKYGLLRNIEATFRSADTNISENTQCSVKPVYGEICNFTEENHGLHWYCGRPRDTQLTCRDWRATTGTNCNSLSPIALKLSRFHKNMILNDLPAIRVIGDDMFVQSDKSPCHKRPKKDTWVEASPSGFYYNSRWRALGCSNRLDHPLSTSYVSCLSGYHVLLIGDSNLRSWFKHIKTMLNMTITTRHLNRKWYTTYEAENVKLNTSLALAVHANPFYGGSTALPKSSIQSVAWQIDRVRTTKNIAIVIHMYLHLARTVSEEYRAHVKEAKRGIDRLLKRAPNAAVFVKGPHAVTAPAFQAPVDYIRQVQEQILHEEFKDIIDKVVFLNQWDMTAGSASVPIHPNKEILCSMVDLFISYLCN
ncbi:NXPE family member 3-like [Ylistrum balloti]|uniref:NXPE family member 3-like n=1 Tax=Ylistrum balloti TaxID=509963 RepID=UPI0029058859|nr:NXPE family member 3-like [Ylistrum balloti]